MDELEPYEALETMEVEEEVHLDDQDPEMTCQVCFAEFLEIEDLQAHMVQVHPEHLPKLASCIFCTLTFSGKYAYSKHLVEKHLVNSKCCKYCSRVFADLFQLLQHEAKHIHQKNKSLYNCSNCPLNFGNVDELERHEYELHNSTSEGFFLFELYSLLSSILSMSVDSFLHSPYNNVLFCVRCRFETTSKSEYVNHLPQHTDSVACDKCFRIFKTKKSLRNHIRKKLTCQLFVKEELLKVKCQLCCKLIHQNLFKVHLRKCKPIKCEPCDRIFSTVPELTKHQFAHHPYAVTLVKCKFCNREYINDVNLQKHIDNIHGKYLHMYKYNCVYCNKLFRHPQKLFGHFFSTHSDINPYTCKICNVTFRVRKAFSLHIKMQHQSKGYVENDERFHVFFTDQKPVKEAVQPKDDAHLDSADVSSKDAGRNAEQDSTEDTPEQKVAFKEESEEETKPVFKRLNSNRISSDRMKAIKSEAEDIYSENSDDEPLMSVKKRKRKIKPKKQKKVVRLKKKHKLSLTCDICNKFCYTYQNYERHKSLHTKNVMKRCIKCSQVFKSTKLLNSHIESAHSSSKLTETLKSLLERRKLGVKVDKFTIRKRILDTFKKVATERTARAAVIRPLSNHNWSVKKFIENFVPENTEKKYQSIENTVTINLLDSQPERKSTIVMKKFSPEPPIDLSNVKLAMPVKYKEPAYNEVYHKVSMRIVQHPQTAFNIELQPLQQKYDANNYDISYDHQEEYGMEDDVEPETIIPDVAQEVMLEESIEDNKEKPPKTKLTYKISIPNLPKHIEEMRIAHLLPEAPFYKIVKVKDVITTNQQSAVEEEAPAEVVDYGTKLINVNPLAHFFKNKSLEDVLPTEKKYYKPKQMNYPLAIAKALLELDKPKPRKNSRKRKLNETGS